MTDSQDFRALLMFVKSKCLQNITDVLLQACLKNNCPSVRISYLVWPIQVKPTFAVPCGSMLASAHQSFLGNFRLRQRLLIPDFPHYLLSSGEHHVAICDFTSL